MGKSLTKNKQEWFDIGIPRLLSFSLIRFDIIIVAWWAANAKLIQKILIRYLRQRHKNNRKRAIHKTLQTIFHTKQHFYINQLVLFRNHYNINKPPKLLLGNHTRKLPLIIRAINQWSVIRKISRSFCWFILTY